MSKSTRMFEIIQLLRSADGPMTGQTLADRLEVTKRTIYRDIAALQAMRVPISGEAGIGYIMRPGYDLPPLMLTEDEIEAIAVGLAMLGRTGDAGLRLAAGSAGRKIGSVLPGGGSGDLKEWPFFASDWTEVPAAAIDLKRLRRAIRAEEKLRISYRDADCRETERTVLPLAMTYYIEAVVLAAWCELRKDFRHFRVDRVLAMTPTGDRFAGRGARLRAEWEKAHAPAS